MTAKALILVAAAGSAALLLGAFAFQYIGGLPPCAMCLWQRWPHAAAILVGGAALALPFAILPLLGAAAALSTASIGSYHVGVERGWWEGPGSCSGGMIGGLSTDELMDRIMTAPLVRCDEVAWQMAGLSMAGWNAVLSLGLCVLWIAAWRARSAGRTGP